MKLAFYKLEVLSEGNNGLPKELNKIWRDFLMQEYDNDKEEIIPSSKKRKRKFESKNYKSIA